MVRSWHGLVFDALLPRGEGFNLLSYARTRECDAPAIVVGTTLVRDAVQRAFALGAFFVIDVLEPDLERWAEHAVAATQRTYDPVLSVWAKRHGLTDTESDILREAVEGDVHKDIARKRDVSANTIKRHVGNLLDKTGDATLSGAALRLLREALGTSRARPRPSFANCAAEPLLETRANHFAVERVVVRPSLRRADASRAPESRTGLPRAESRACAHHRGRS